MTRISDGPPSTPIACGSIAGNSADWLVSKALLFRQLTGDLAYFGGGTELDADTRARFAASGIQVVDTPVDAIESTADGDVAGVRRGATAP